MSVAPRAAPSMSERSRMLSRRGSNREEEELAVGAVVVMLSDKSDDQSAAAYRPPAGDAAHDDSKPISTARAQKEHRFVAVLAPNCDAAMASLLSQPPGTYLLVKEEDAAIAVYVKFRQAVRALTLVKGKDVKKNDDAIQLAKLRKKDIDALMQTPVHTLRLTSEAYYLVEHCWKRFLPQVQAVVFELCCEPYLDEDTKLEDWNSSMIPAGYSVALMPEACGFCILALNSSTPDSSSSAVIQVRQVEFDFNKFAITVADGTLKPSALLLSTSFSAKRTFEPSFTFSAIRDNFMSPDQVILKETSITTNIPSQQVSLQNCIDLSSSDKELSILSAAEAACGAVMPHESLPDTFVTVICEMHVHFTDVVANAGANPSAKPAPWSAPKMKLVGRIIPILVELLVASAAFSEKNSSPEPMDVAAAATESRKRQILAQFSYAMRFDILFMTARSDDSVICRLTHQLCQLLGARIRLPSELVDFIRDLVALFPVFLRLFLRNQGVATLWKNLHHNDADKDGASDSRSRSAIRSFRALASSSSSSVVNAFHGKGDRKLLLFGLSRKTQTKSRKSLSLGTNTSAAPFLSSKALAFFRLSPMSVQVDLGARLRESQFLFPDIWTSDAVLARISFCCCSKQHPDELRSRSVSFYGQPAPKFTPCVRRALRSSPKMIMYELLLQLSLRFLYNKASFSSWDRDVALLLRLEDVYQHLFNEVISIVRRRSHIQDINARDALTCELRVVIACVSTLFRLERKRRQEISSAVGDKKYAAFINSFRTKLREFNGRLKGEASSADGQADAAEAEGDDQIDEVDERFLVAMVEVFRWIPRAFLDEWIVLSLKELLQVLDGLNSVIRQTPIPMTKQLQYVRHIHESFQVFAVIMKRVSDPDVQMMIVRVLGMDCSSIVSLLRYALSTNTLCLNGGRDAVCIQKFAIGFLGAFVNLDVALPVQSEWESSNTKPSEHGSMSEDQEVIEQLKGELLIRLLGPRVMTDDGEQNEQNLWDFILGLLFPSNGATAVSGSSRMLSLAVSFRSVTTPPTLLTTIARGHFQMKESFLQLQQALYTAQDVASSVDYDVCVASHMRHIAGYFDRIIENAAQEERYMVYRTAELHFRCLVVLASRRSQFPAIQEAFNHVHVVTTILKWLQTQPPTQPESTGNVTECVEIATPVTFLPPLKLPRQHSSTDSFGSQSGVAKLTLASPHSADAPFPQHFLLLEPGLHALAIVLLVSFVIVDPNLEIDEKICPRVSVPEHDTATDNSPHELLWTLQQHLVAVEMDQRYFEALTLEMETLQAFVSTARLSAIRLMLRLLCPNRFDRNLYTTPTQSNNVQSRHSREYIAKGAFSTVYKQHPALPRPEAVAIKVVEHQRRTGELCAVSGLYNEVSILSKLRGDLAATQLVDFGNHHAEQTFEIVMEYCPCSLTDWRATIDRSDGEAPFRSCLVMILRAFEEACQCLSRIHQAGVCHFDVKGDNILVRSSARELSRRLLENEDEHDDDDNDNASNREFKAWLCIADFGESKLVDSHQLPVRTFTFSSFTSGSASPVAVQKTEKFMYLSRTRGTEAIKSPEVLKIKGSEDVEVKVTLASDIWSLGCLLYELVTQELLFQNDDWAGLYAHLVVTQDQAVFRWDHKQKVFDALKPSCPDEEEVVTALTELCSKILTRDARKRPSLAAIAKHVRKLINDVYELPVTASDQSFIISLFQSGGETSASASAHADAHRSLAPALRPFVSAAPRSRRPEANGVTVPVRFFWNFFLAAHVTRAQDRRAVTTSCVGSGHGPVSKDVLAMEAFEAKHEGDFVHFVYLAWHDSSSPPGGPDAHESLVEELYEDEHRSVFLLNPHLKASVETQLTADVHSFQQLVQHAPLYFPVLQRRLREEAGCVVFVVLGRDAEDTTELQHVLTGMLLFFLRSAMGMTPFEILSQFARDCAQFFDYPRVEFLQQFLSYSTPVAEDTAVSSMVQCRCGSIVFSVESSAMSDALAAQRCTCQTSDKNGGDCPCFHPFPVGDHSDQDAGDEDDEVFPVDSMFVHDACEEQLVHPMETRARRRQEVRWVSLDSASVSRVDRPAFRWSSSGPRLGRGTSSESTRSIPADGTGSGGERRMSRFGLKRRASKVPGDGTGATPRLSGKEAGGGVRAATEPQEMHDQLVRGLQRRGKPADADSPSSESWDLYECELCRLPICALSEGKVAVPLLSTQQRLE